MGKDPSRKPKRRQPNPPQLDDDLAELASVLVDNASAIGTLGWFEVPWRSGWPAAVLAMDAWLEFASNASRDLDVAKTLMLVMSQRENTPETYEIVEEVLSESVVMHKIIGNDWATLLRACARCVQLQVSNSSGGGNGYNAVLKPTFLRLEDNGYIFDLAPLVLEARCIDALGTTSKLQNDKYDRERRAFAIAWNRGLYQAAYSIKRIS